MKKTSLYQYHINAGAKIVDFAGYQMPISYPSGINSECNSVRTNVGMFDVSHMGQILIEGHDSFEFVQHLTTNNVSKIDDGQCQYTLLCNKDGGIIDDLILYRIKENKFLLVVNASNIDKDYSWIKTCLSMLQSDISIKNLSPDISLIAIQGPESRKILSNFKKIKDSICDLNFYHFSDFSEENELRIISRTGYTGELGYEIYGSHRYIKDLWRELVENYNINPIGLAARDILRLEMCYRLYGNDMDESISPYECDLGWVVHKAKDADFIGKENIQFQIDKKLIALSMNEKGIPRKGYKIYSNQKEVGYITSGTFSPTLNKGIALGYINIDNIHDKNILIKVRDKFLSGSIIKGAFIKGNSLFG